jgi:hypothetical protein
MSTDTLTRDTAAEPATNSGPTTLAELAGGTDVSADLAMLFWTSHQLDAIRDTITLLASTADRDDNDRDVIDTMTADYNDLVDEITALLREPYAARTVSRGFHIDPGHATLEQLAYHVAKFCHWVDSMLSIKDFLAMRAQGDRAISSGGLADTDTTTAGGPGGRGSYM